MFTEEDAIRREMMFELGRYPYWGMEIEGGSFSTLKGIPYSSDDLPDPSINKGTRWGWILFGTGLILLTSYISYRYSIYDSEDNDGDDNEGDYTD